MLGLPPKTIQFGKFPNAAATFKKGVRTALGCALFAAMFSLPATAQIVPDPNVGGTIRNDAERSMQAPSLPQVSPKSGAQAPREQKPKGETVIVSRFRFIGNTQLSDASLSRAVEPYIGRPIDFDELQNAAAMAALAYRDRGYVATVSIPKQELEDGIITLKVSEARYGGARLDPNSDGRIHSEIILARVERAMNLEKAVNTNVLDRTLLLVNDLPGASVQGGLAEGKVEGETEVVLKSSRKPLITGSATIDQQGAIATGAQRHLVDIAINSPSGRGEQYTSALMLTEGTNYGRVGASFPVGLDGARAGVNASYLDYRVVAGTQVLAKLEGRSSGIGADISYPLIRSQQANLYMSGSVNAKWFDNYSMQRLSRSYETQTAAVGINGNWFDQLMGGGASNQAMVTATLGRLDIKDHQSQISDAATTRTDGMYGKLNIAVSRTQALAEGWSLNASGVAQFATNNLDSSEKFYLGGANGLRAYPSSEGGGNSGELLQLEFRKRFAWFELRLFRDEGRVRQTIDSYLGQPSPNILHYRGKGWGIVVPLPYNVTVNFTWSRRIGNNPNPAPSGNDQDGTKVIDRVWLSATMSF